MSNRPLNGDGPTDTTGMKSPPAYIKSPPLNRPRMSQEPNRQTESRTTLNDTPSQSIEKEETGEKGKYEEWYPGDASHNGRPAWWNRLFCCGYGLGCLLCPCGSWTCKQERR